MDALLDHYTRPNPNYAKAMRFARNRYVKVPKEILNYEVTPDTVIFPRGGANVVRRLLDGFGYRVSWKDLRLTLPPVQFEPTKRAKPIEFFLHQEEIIEVALRRENALIRAATGSGKTDAALELIRRIGQPALVIVWTGGLLSQWVERIIERWGWRERDVGIFGGGKKVLDRPIVIAMQQSLWKNLEGTVITERFGVVVMDECFEGSIPVLMADGTEKPIRDIREGEQVALGGRVRSTMNRISEVSYVLEGYRLTDEHPLATEWGWLPASEIGSLDVYKVDRFGPSREEDRGGDRRNESSKKDPNRIRPEEGLLPSVEGVVSNSIEGSVRLRLGRADLRRSPIILRSRVYNLETEAGVYVAAGTLVHNCQRAAAKTYLAVINEFPAKYRIGLSADERRKDRLDFLIHDTFGEAVVDVGKDRLVDQGKLCDVQFLVVPTGFDFPAYLRCMDCRGQILNNPSARAADRRCRCKKLQLKQDGKIEGDYLPIPYSDVPPDAKGEVLKALYVRAISYSQDGERDAVVRRIVRHEAGRGASILIFCNRVEHATELAKTISLEDDIPCGLMLGGAKNRERFIETRDLLREGTIRCAVGSSAVYQGEDIPRLSVGIVVTPTGNNRQQLEQQAGRLRRKWPGKLLGRLYYLWDSDIFPGHRQNIRKWYGRELVKTLDVEDIGEDS